MKNLAQKIVPLVLAGAEIIGCATQPAKISAELEKRPIYSTQMYEGEIDLKNGFSAESYKVHDNILLLTESFLGEAILRKTEDGYYGVKTHDYHTTQGEIFDRTYDEFCEAIDNGGDKFLTEMETEFFLDKVYKTIYGITWVEDE